MEEPRNFELAVTPNHVIRGRLDFPTRPGRRPAVLVAHGFKGFLEWGFYSPLVELLTARGFVTVRFNFSGSGMRPGDELVTDEEAFRNATFSRDVEEVLALLTALAGGLEPDRVDPERIGLLGHSRGAGSSILAAAAAASDAAPRALVTWAAVASFDRLSATEKDHWRSAGEVPVTNARTGQELAIGAKVLDDLEANADELDIPAASGRRTMPWLIVHGTDDETVPVDEARQLAAAACDPFELRLIAGGSHTFGATHPFSGPTPQLIQTLNATQAWFRRHLGE